MAIYRTPPGSRIRQVSGCKNGSKLRKEKVGFCEKNEKSTNLLAEGLKAEPDRRGKENGLLFSLNCSQEQKYKRGEST